MAQALRKDAVRTRTGLLSSAEKLLAEDREASLTEIAVAAGVSHATVYRHFADRTELLIELMERRLDRHEGEVAGWDGGPEDFERLVRLIATEQAKFQGLMAETRQREPDDVRFARLRSRTTEMFRGPLESAKAAGSVRPDRTPEDMVPLLMMVDAATAQHADRGAREVAAEAAVDIILRGIA
jgi:AcrR family transcriptional regulator